MYEILIINPAGEEYPGQLQDGVYRVGSSPASHIQLSGEGIASQHCRLILKNGELYVESAAPGNLILLDDSPVSPSAPLEVFPGQTLTLGEFRIAAKGDPEKLASFPSMEELPPPQEEESFTAPPPPEKRREQEEIQWQTVETEHGRVLAVSGVPLAVRPLLKEIKKKAHAELIKRLNLKRLTMTGASSTDLEKKARETIHEIVQEISIELPEGLTREKICRELENEAIGLGPLEDLIDMPGITEVMVNGPDQIYVEYKGKLQKTDMAFADNSQVLAAIERIVSPLGRRIDESSPMVDARLKDGSRVNAIIPPLSLVGPSITIRKFSKNPLQVNDLVRFGSITHKIAHFLDVCVKIRKNIIISGGTGSGKTTLLNILSSFLPDTERIITIEDAAELQLRQDHVVRLEARPSNIEGKGEISIRDLVKNSLRMRPDRIVIGECRGGEALDMLQAMNTGHDGSLTTIHANSPRDALARLETLVLMAGFDLPLRAIREQIASAITIIVQISREKDGSRKVNCVSEITKMEGDIITMQDIFVYRQTGWTPDGKMTGDYVPTGNIPTFMEEITRAGLDLDISIFTPPKKERDPKL